MKTTQQKLDALHKDIINLSKRYRLSNPEHEILATDMPTALHENRTSSRLNFLLLSLYTRFSGHFQYDLYPITSKYFTALHPGQKYISSSRLSCQSNGTSANRSFSGLSGFTCQKFNSSDLNNIVLSLKNTGYAVAPFLIKKSILNGWLHQTMNFEKFTLKDSDDNVSIDQPLWRPQDFAKNIITAFAKPADIFRLKDIRELIFSPELFYIASQYLNVQTLFLSNINLWFSFASAKESSESAQLFHYDQASLKWLKIFIYLRDVDHTNGPHVGVLKSHLPGTKPQTLLSRGYARIPDTDIKNYFLGQYQRIFSSAGTVIFADTNAFHKGMKVERGYRSILEINFNCDPIGDMIYKHE